MREVQFDFSHAQTAFPTAEAQMALQAQGDVGTALLRLGEGAASIGRGFREIADARFTDRQISLQEGAQAEAVEAAQLEQANRAIALEEARGILERGSVTEAVNIADQVLTGDVFRGALGPAYDGLSTTDVLADDALMDGVVAQLAEQYAAAPETVRGFLQETLRESPVTYYPDGEVVKAFRHLLKSGYKVTDAQGIISGLVGSQGRTLAEATSARVEAANNRFRQMTQRASNVSAPNPLRDGLRHAAATETSMPVGRVVGLRDLQLSGLSENSRRDAESGVSIKTSLSPGTRTIEVQLDSSGRPQDKAGVREAVRQEILANPQGWMDRVGARFAYAEHDDMATIGGGLNSNWNLDVRWVGDAAPAKRKPSAPDAPSGQRPESVPQSGLEASRSVLEALIESEFDRYSGGQ